MEYSLLSEDGINVGLKHCLIGIKNQFENAQVFAWWHDYRIKTTKTCDFTWVLGTEYERTREVWVE